MSPAPILETAGLVAGYEPGLPIVGGVDLALRPGEIKVVLGPNGAGKSTLIKAIGGLVPIFEGNVRLAGETIAGLPAHRMVRRGLAFVPQTDNIFARMSIADNLRLPAFVVGKAERAVRIEAMFSLFPDLARERRLLAGRLSGGQRQMLAIARAMLIGPKVLMLDEPSAGLSPKLVEMVFAKLQEIARAGVAVLLVAQNARAALAIADRACVLAEGRTFFDGDAAGLWHDPALSHLYLGVRASAERGGAGA
jgi:branched-chain amino acid transport system ATP-binding protein